MNCFENLIFFFIKCALKSVINFGKIDVLEEVLQNGLLNTYRNQLVINHFLSQKISYYPRILSFDEFFMTMTMDSNLDFKFCLLKVHLTDFYITMIINRDRL